MKRYYSMEVIVYSDQPQHVVDILHCCDFVRHYLVCLHDSDVSEDGSPLKPHCHCVLTFSREVGFSYVSKRLTFFADGLFSVNENQCQSIKGSLRDCYDYLLHRYEVDKVPYSSDRLFSDDIRRFRNDHSDRSNVAYNILVDLESRLSLRELAQKYGRDFILNYNRYMDFLSFMRDNERPNIIPVPSVNVDFSGLAYVNDDDGDCP